jgi:hypothetical protein
MGPQAFLLARIGLMKVDVLGLYYRTNFTGYESAAALSRIHVLK